MSCVQEMSTRIWGMFMQRVCLRVNYAGEGVPYFRGDLAVRGVWETHGEAMFDIRVVDTDTISYISRSVSAVLKNVEEEKQSMY